MFKVNKIHVHQCYYHPFCPRNVWMVDDWWTGWEHDRVITDYIHVSCFAPTRAIYRPGLSVFYIVSLYLIVCHLSCIETDVMSYHDILTSITVNLHLVTFQHSHRCKAIVKRFFSRKSDSTLTNVCPFVCQSVSHGNRSTAWNHHPSTFIILASFISRR